MWRTLRSFKYALAGIAYAIKTQTNMRVHVTAALLVILAAVLLQISARDWLFLLLAVTLVITTELINTALEAVVDLASPEIHPLAKIAKDTAAGAVLVTAAFAVIVGIIVFYEPLLKLMGINY